MYGDGTVTHPLRSRLRAGWAVKSKLSEADSAAQGVVVVPEFHLSPKRALRGEANSGTCMH